MKPLYKGLIIGVGLLLVALLVVVVRAAWVGAQDPDKQETEDTNGPTVGEPVKPGVSNDVKSLPTAEPWKPGTPIKEVNPRQLPKRSPPATREDSCSQAPSDQKEDEFCASPDSQ